jgi:hypothetical protein
MKRFRSARFIFPFIMIAIVLIAGAAILSKDRTRERPPISAEPVSEMTPSHADVHLKGVTLRRGTDNGVLCTLSIGEIKLVKKKMGLFRIGGLRQLEVDNLNVRIDFSDPAPRNGTNRSPGTDLLLADFLLSFKPSLESMTGGIALSGLEGNHVGLEVYRLDQRVMFLKADSFSLSRNKKLFFQGNARVEWQGRVWKGHRVWIDPVKMVMQLGREQKIPLGQLLGQVA